MNGIGFAFLLTLFAGLATCLGGVLVIFFKKEQKAVLSVCLSFSAGVMLYIAFGEIFKESFEMLKDIFGDGTGYLVATIAFFAGIIVMAGIDRLVPHDDKVADLIQDSHKELKHTGVMSAIAIALHNLPEGLVTFMAAMHDPIMGVAVAIAIIIHNIPEGLAVATPIYYSTGKKGKAIAYAAAAGATEPLGALLAWLVLSNIFEEIEPVVGIVFAAAAGVMVFVAIHQLLPTAQKHGKHHSVMTWMFAGMVVMALSLVILEFIF